MADNSSIEWTEATWNPVSGCTRVSAGCDNCYAVAMTKRLENMGNLKYSGLVSHAKNHFNGVVKVHPDTLDTPLKWKKPRTIFVNSMSDLFHKNVPDTFILEVFDVMRRAGWHQFQVLTKRPERAEEMNAVIDWPSNVWIGTSVEDDRVVERIDRLRATSATIRFLSLEPLLGPLPNLNLQGINWVIVGGESGPNSRSLNIEWVKDIREQCLKLGVSFFFKQLGSVLASAVGTKDNKGSNWSDLPLAIRVREYPALTSTITSTNYTVSDARADKRIICAASRP